MTLSLISFLYSICMLRENLVLAHCVMATFNTTSIVPTRVNARSSSVCFEPDDKSIDDRAAFIAVDQGPGGPDRPETAAGFAIWFFSPGHTTPIEYHFFHNILGHRTSLLSLSSKLLSYNLYGLAPSNDIRTLRHHGLDLSIYNILSLPAFSSDLGSLPSPKSLLHNYDLASHGSSSFGRLRDCYQLYFINRTISEPSECLPVLLTSQSEQMLELGIQDVIISSEARGLSERSEGHAHPTVAPQQCEHSDERASVLGTDTSVAPVHGDIGQSFNPEC